MLLDITMWVLIGIAGCFIVFFLFGMLDKGIDAVFRDRDDE
jgi:hypothetical protein